MSKRDRLKIIFMGTPQFALPCLELLIESDEEIQAVITRPDTPQGRGRKITAPPVKRFAEKHNLTVIQPRNVNQADFIKEITGLKPDLLVVVAFGKILSADLLAVPVYGGINVHASLLPKYRGGAPINWAIIEGEKQTGVTIMKIEEKLDRGGIILQKKIDILPDEDAVTLHDKLSVLGKEALREAIDLIKKGELTVHPQGNRETSFAPNLKKENGLVNWQKDDFQIHNLIRGTIPWPGAFTYINLSGKKVNLKIWKSSLSQEDSSRKSKPGEIVALDRAGWKVATRKGLILIKEVQTSGGKRLSAYDFSLGHNIKPGVVLGE